MLIIIPVRHREKAPPSRGICSNWLSFIFTPKRINQMNVDQPESVVFEISD